MATYQERRARRRLIFALLMIVPVPALHMAYAQVGPAEMTNPRLKSLEANYLPQLLSVAGAINRFQFPFGLFLSRYVGLDPKQQAGADARGLEFVLFHDRTVLKISGNYNAAFDSSLLTRNERASRVFDGVVAPILGLLPEHFSTQANFDCFGFEISYHVRTHSSSYDYERKETLAVIMDKSDALGYVNAQTESGRQSVLNASEIYVNGEAFGLALHAAQEFGPDELASLRRAAPAEPVRAVSVSGTPAAQPHAGTMAGARGPGVMTDTPTDTEIEALQNKLQSQIDTLGKEGIARYHFIDYAPPSLIIFRNRIHLQMTLRNPNPFDRNTTSIYRRAAQSFDLFLAPLLKSLLERAPASKELAGFDITVLDEFGANSEHSPEALEFIFPLQPLRGFTGAEISNQDLINQSIVLVNGVRIALELQRVE